MTLESVWINPYFITDSFIKDMHHNWLHSESLRKTFVQNDVACLHNDVIYLCSDVIFHFLFYFIIFSSSAICVLVTTLPIKYTEIEKKMIVEYVQGDTVA